MNTLMKLQAVKFYYKADDSDQKLGFIAEDVPDLVAEKDRKSLNAMDLATLAIKVIQVHHGEIENIKKEVKELKKK
jgi:hypothetical protein